MGTILIQAEEVWTYFCSHRNELLEGEILIAFNQDFNVEIYMTTDRGELMIVVNLDDEPVHSEYMYDKLDCTHSMKVIYDKYLSERIVNELILSDAFVDDPVDDSYSDGSYAEVNEEIIIDEREGDLSIAVNDMLDSILPGNVEIDDDLIEDIKDAICERLYAVHGISVYRPMFLEDDDGSDYVTEYPYPEMELEEA